jgi:RNA polymerase sigma-B factor
VFDLAPAAVTRSVRAGKYTIDEIHREYLATKNERLCEALVESYKHLAISLGRRMSRRLGERDDVTQVAMVGLLKAINRFDPDRGVGFTTFAWRTIEGEVKRYFRDSSWSVHVPRSLQERSIAVAQTVEQLTHDLGTSPTISQIAQDLTLTDEEVVEVLELRRATRPMSIDVDDDEQENSSPLQIGEMDDGFELSEERDALSRLLRVLPDREQEVVRLRFIDQLTQSEIANRIGVSQMHVSRLLAKSLVRLREYDRRLAQATV